MIVEMKRLKKVLVNQGRKTREIKLHKREDPMGLIRHYHNLRIRIKKDVILYSNEH
jgi:hypothetical protein